MVICYLLLAEGVKRWFYHHCNAAMRGGLEATIEVQLFAAGGRPMLDYADANAFLQPFERVVDKTLKRKIK